MGTYTGWLETKLDEFMERVYNIEDGLTSIADNEKAIVDYLSTVCYSLPLGLAIRRFICEKYSKGDDKETGNILFELSTGETVSVVPYLDENYDLINTDIETYIRLFIDICHKYNLDSEGKPMDILDKAEIRRLLRSETMCRRNKVFLIGFALHMDGDDMYKFLTDVLAEPTYNMRDPNEVIAFFCQTHESFNSYNTYLKLVAEYESMSKPEYHGQKQEGYTLHATMKVMNDLLTKEELLQFLRENMAELSGYSRTIYKEFVTLYTTALRMTKIQPLSNDEYIAGNDSHTSAQREERERMISNAICLRAAENPEQLARAMLDFIPRDSFENNKGKKRTTFSDFVPIVNGERGQKGKKEKTTILPKQITMNLLMRDRIDDLLNEKIPVDRKDLVFLSFYIFWLKLSEQQDYVYNARTYNIFKDECNSMLMRCGMSRLYLANRFENLILLSLCSSMPFEFFGEIIYQSFFFYDNEE